MSADLSTPVPLRRRADLSALWTLFVLTFRQQLRGRRLLLLSFLFSLPSVIVLLIRTLSEQPPSAADLEIGTLLTLLPNLLIPLAALLGTSGMVQDEIEDQTLTYLLMRPIPKQTLYLTKFVATFTLTVTLASVFMILTTLSVYLGSGAYTTEVLLERILILISLTALSLLAYCGLFGLLSLWTARALVAGVIYILIFEGIIANIPFAVRNITVMFQVRVLTLDWLALDVRNNPWGIEPNAIPSSQTCLLTLICMGMIAGFLASLIFANREFRVKTPEGS